ncbi:hypothetical protein [Bradyrhizobium sp. NAS96.2]|uniref:hypothetical protein n=1 Tax=Bradyrhizobium sp. NAS96.2 TaxID=1680160 RepID=UPI000939DA31|nr:hypothetical protein [Bradyrhizobium sp. NAS96.2]OKO84091.1 hypothetical protein AC628_00720 [Bradyrhizobium sp. NAS96.2]
MPINRLLKEGEYTPEQIDLLNKAFNYALHSMGLVDRNDPLCEMVARKVIEASAGTGDAKEIAELAVIRIGLR